MRRWSFYCGLQVDVQLNGAVVAAKNIRVDLGVPQFRLQPVRGDKVVNTPTGVLLSGVEHIAPPAVYAGGIRVKVAESIGESAAQQVLWLFLR